MNRAFSLVQVVVITAIVGVCAMLFVPTVSAQSKGEAKTWQMNQLQQLGSGMLAYSWDWDDAFPLAAYHKPGDNFWVSGAAIPTPANCVDVSPWNTPERIAISSALWRNSITPYTAANNYLPGAPQVSVTGDVFVGTPLLNHSTYNGLLHAMHTYAVNSPNVVPMLWSGLQRVNLTGRAMASPGLLCDTNPTCKFNPNGRPGGPNSSANGNYYVWDFTTTVWIYGQRAPVVKVDGSIALLPSGLMISPAAHAWPNVTVDPWGSVSTTGAPVSIWNCGPGHTVATPNPGTDADRYPCYFRPDRTE